MFGMLDYRAHKLYLILFFIPTLILMLVSVLGLPLINYSIGLYLAENRLYQVLISCVSLFIVEVVFLLIVKLFTNFFQFVFSLLIDVIPHDGRSKDEATFVVWGGEAALKDLAMSKHPTTWVFGQIDEYVASDWVQRIFYKDVVTRRLNLIYEYYQDHPEDSSFDEFDVNLILSKHNLQRGWQETALTSGPVRKMFFAYSFFLYLIIFQPF